MANYNIGPRIGIEGEAQFRSQISRINSEYKSMASYTNAVSAAMEKQGKTQTLLESKANGLRQQIALQEKAYKQYSDALESVKKLEGDHANDITRYEGALLHVRTEIDRLSQELSDTDDELERLVNGIEDLDEAADNAGDGMEDLGDKTESSKGKAAAAVAAFSAAGAALIGFGKSAVEAAAEVKAANAQFSQTFGNLERTATAALQSVSSETGIAVTRLQSGYTSLYAFTKSVGGDSETALNIAQRALLAAADSAAYYDRTMEDATETLQSFLKGNYANDAALGIAATETTRNAKANELYAKSFNELTEAQKVDTLLAMVEAGNKASGALGQAAREADSWANVTGELSEAWRQLLAALGSPVMEGLIPVIQEITGALQVWTTQTEAQKLTAGIDAFRAGLQEADAALADSSTQISAQAALAQIYTDRLRQIEGAGLDTAESQREYAQTVELLNTLMPELGLTINEVTGRLEQGTWAIEDNIQALKEQAEQQARMTHYKAIIDEYSAAYESLYAAQVREKELLAQQEQLLARGAQAYAAMSYAQAGSTGAMAEFNAALTEDDKALAAVNYELAALGSAIATAETELAAAEARVNAATEAYGSLADTSQEVTAAVDGTAEAVQQLNTAYAEAADEARDSLDSQIGLFTELADKSDWSAKKIIENWEKQQKAFTNYGENLQKAMELGLDEALVRQLSDGSQQSMQILDALVNGTQADIDAINASFRGLNQAKDEVATVMGEIQVITDEAFSEIIQNAENSGRNTVLGCVQGVEDNIWRFERVMEKMGSRGASSFDRTLEINSPSRVLQESGEWTVLGGVKGVQDNIWRFERAMESLGDRGASAYNREILETADAYPALISGAEGYTTSAVTNNRTVSLGGVAVNVYTQPGQNPNEFADAVLAVLTQKLGEAVASF